jgi:hypothetical protein
MYNRGLREDKNKERMFFWNFKLLKIIIINIKIIIKFFLKYLKINNINQYFYIYFFIY